MQNMGKGRNNNRGKGKGGKGGKGKGKGKGGRPRDSGEGDDRMDGKRRRDENGENSSCTSRIAAVVDPVFLSVRRISPQRLCAGQRDDARVLQGATNASKMKSSR